MENPAADRLIRQIHDSGRQLVLAVTGGGSGAIASLLNVPGASRSVLEAVVPYSAAALVDWLGGRPERFCGDRTGRAMAMAAYKRAQELAPGAAGIVGIGCTASLTSDRPKRGDHRIHVAWQSESTTGTAGLLLIKDRRTRAEEERVVDALVLSAVAQACGLTADLQPQLLPGEQIQAERYDAPPAWRDLWTGRVKAVAEGVSAGAEPPQAVFPGAFNPRHAGHERMANVAAQVLGVPVDWELSVLNVDKPPLDYLEVSRRLAQHPAGRCVWLTRAPTFARKAELFPGATFIVGADTIVRIADPHYYGGDPRARDAAIEQIARHGCRFLVFGRVAPSGGGVADRAAGAFITLAQLVLPPSLQALCREIPAEQFREDISSTELRAGDPEA